MRGSPPGGWFRLPCHDQWRDGCGIKRSCADYSPFTVEEVAAQDAEMAAAVKRIQASESLVARVKRENKGRDARGLDTCPVCGKPLAWSHAGYNGHVAMKCETEDCIAFME